MIYACDFDKTLSFAPYPDVGSPNMPLIKFLADARTHGDKVILWTCRTGEALDRAVKFCEGVGLRFDTVNDNLPELVELYSNNPRKVNADIYIDDKSIHVDEFVQRHCKSLGTVRGLRVKRGR